MVCSTYCEAPAKVSGGSRTLVCIKGFTFSHFSGKASAGAPDTRDDEAPPEKCKKIYIPYFLDLTPGPEQTPGLGGEVVDTLPRRLFMVL